MRMRYKLPTEKSVKVITLITLLIPAAILCWLYTIDKLLTIVTSTLLFIIFVVIYAYTPREVMLDEKGIVIRRIFGQIIIPYGKIKGVSFIDKLGWKTVRIFGSGGLFGWFGLFYVPEVGEVYVYAKRRDNLVLVKADKNYLIAPENPEEFIQSLLKKLKITS